MDKKYIPPKKRMAMGQKPKELQPGKSKGGKNKC